MERKIQVTIMLGICVSTLALVTATCSYVFTNPEYFSGVKSVEFYYSETCPHCHKIMPFIEDMKSKYSMVNWEFIEVNKAQISVPGVPFLLIETSDGRFISLVGSADIPKYLECELKEQSSIECPTTPYLNKTTNSYFIRN